MHKQKMEVCQRCGLRPLVSDQKIVLGLARYGLGLVLCSEIRSCYAHHHNDLEGHGNFSNIWCSTYSFKHQYKCLLIDNL